MVQIIQNDRGAADDGFCVVDGIFAKSDLSLAKCFYFFGCDICTLCIRSILPAPSCLKLLYQISNFFFDLLIIKTARKIQMCSVQAFCQHGCTVFCRRVTGNKNFCTSKLLVFRPCFTGWKFPQSVTGTSQQSFDVTAFIKYKVASNERYCQRIWLLRDKRIVHCLSQFLIRCQSMFLHDRIHEAAHKNDLRKTCA